VYRIVQEALTNVVKHAGATRASVTITEGDDDVIEVRVSDDGRGFDPSATAEGFGLVGMTERVDLLDGEMHIDSAPGDGTTVTVRLPVARAAEPASSSAVRSAEGP
jgi:signal transduction histidine kinase